MLLPCPRAARRLALLCTTLILPLTLLGCGNTLFDQDTAVSDDSFWAQSITLTANSRVSIDMSSDRSVDCLLMCADQFSSFQSAVNNSRAMIVHFSYMRDFSGERTTKFAKTATLPSGTWYFVVMNAHNGLASASGTAHFKIKVDGPMAASAGSPTTGGRSASPEPSLATPNFPTPRQPINSDNPPQPVAPPPPPPMKLSFANLEEAVTILARGQTPERHAALSFLANQDVVADKRSAVMSLLIPMLNDQQYHTEVQPLVLKWASKNDAPRLRTALDGILSRNPAQLDPASARDAVAIAKLLLSYGDDQALTSLIRLLPATGADDDARAALASSGTAAESPLIDALSKIPASANSRDAQVLPDYLSLLAAVGTEKSIEPLQNAMAAKDAAIAKAASDALTALADRLKLKPDQYLFNLFNHYVVEAPAAFAADPTMTQPNTRRWTRTAPNRTVKSTYTVQVTRVGKDYKLAALPNAAPIQAGGDLLFYPLALPAVPQFTQASHVAAVHGEFLIDVLAIVDTTDRTAQTNLSNAVKKIKAK